MVYSGLYWVIIWFIWVFIGLYGFTLGYSGLYGFILVSPYPPIMEDQMEESMENEMETGIIG